MLSEKELKRVLSVAAGMRHGERNKLIVLISHLAGLRVGELAHLKMGDVYADDGSTRSQVYIKPAYSKGQKGRVIFINAKLIKALTIWRQVNLGLSTRLSARKLHADAPLIGSQKRRHFSPNSLCQLFGEIYALAGIETSSHAGRRFFITRLAHSGISPKVIMELAGHSQLTTTQRYIDVDDDMKREAVEVL